MLKGCLWIVGVFLVVAAACAIDVGANRATNQQIEAER